MKVIKLGGSLMNDKHSLIQSLNTIEKKIKDKVVIVPGGGVFADKIRALQKQWLFDDQIAHQMALLSMKQMALLYKSIKQCLPLADNIFAIQQVLVDYPTVIWCPDIDELNRLKIKASWAVTSDSLAVWLAEQLAATELILVKSAPSPLTDNVLEWAKQGLVDQAFQSMSKTTSFKITVIHKHQFNEHSFI